MWSPQGLEAAGRGRAMASDKMIWRYWAQRGRAEKWRRSRGDGVMQWREAGGRRGGSSRWVDGDLGRGGSGIKEGAVDGWAHRKW